jgi:bacteriorhodopsin
MGGHGGLRRLSVPALWGCVVTAAGTPRGERRKDIRAGIYAGWMSVVPVIVAAIGWTAHWNAYFNLMLTLGGAVLMWTALACTLDRYQRDRRG